MTSKESELLQHEDRLRAAMLAGDIDALDHLIGDALTFINHDGRWLSKSDDLDAYRAGLDLTKLEFATPPFVRLLGDAAVTSVVADIVGTFAGQKFSGAFAYTRVWQCGLQGWQVVAGHCSQVR